MRRRCALIPLGIPLAVLLAGGAVAYAAWVDGDLRRQITPLAAVAATNAANTHWAIGNTPQDGSNANSATSVYTALEVTVEPGTWFIEATGAVHTTPEKDGVQLSLRDETQGVTIPGSAGTVTETTSISGTVALHTSVIYTVKTNRVIMMQGTTNGATQLHFGYKHGLTDSMRIVAVRLQ
jgi:hypothetical protein